jgi:hypothetical protein
MFLIISPQTACILIAKVINRWRLMTGISRWLSACNAHSTRNLLSLAHVPAPDPSSTSLMKNIILQYAFHIQLQQIAYVSGCFCSLDDPGSQLACNGLVRRALPRLRHTHSATTLQRSRFAACLHPPIRLLCTDAHSYTINRSEASDAAEMTLHPRCPVDPTGSPRYLQDTVKLRGRNNRIVLIAADFVQ